MSLWTRHIHGEKEEGRSPLLPDSAAPEVYRGQDSSYAQAASAHPADEYPDPVKPNYGLHNTYDNSYSARSFAPPPVYSHGDVAIGQPVLPQATEPPAPGHSQLVTDDRRIVQQKMKGSSVIVCCPQCGHTGPARVTKGSGFMTFFTSGLLCFLGCCPLAIFPFCCDCTKDWIYSCSVCGTLFGRERP